LGLSLNSKGNLLVASYDKVILEYTSSGTLVRQVPDTSRLWHVAEVNNGTWAVSHYSTRNEICLMSTSGTTLRCTASGQIGDPSDVAVSCQGYILVADSGNDRIAVVNPALTDVRTLALPVNSQGPICYPYGVFLDEVRGRLYVGESCSPSRLMVYDNVFNLSSAFTP
jgi:DNA-binding beta-propeller fold protein YncE